jgi:hypothetical protein
LLTSTLTLEVAAKGPYRVVSLDELSELLQNEASRQGMGTDDPGVVREMAGALGAEFLVQSSVVLYHGELSWQATLTRTADGAIVNRFAVTGQSLRALSSQVSELVLGLLGREAETRLKGQAAQTRFGFSSAEDLEEFARFRSSQPKHSTQETLTRFILERNLESRVLAAAQATLFLMASLPLPLVTALTVVGFFLLAPYPLAVFALFPCNLLLCATSMGLGAMGVSLVGLDALNVRHVSVLQNGCCRDDAEIRDEERDTGWHRAAAFLALLAGPSTLAGQVAAGSVAFLLGGLMFQALGQPRSASPIVVSLATAPFGCSIVLFLLSLPMCCVTTSSGACLLFWPARHAVEPVSATQPPQNVPEGVP